ncbi:MAG: hypothetical protein CMJ78_03685 [Planctomycetaceae bacterium]|nr:hypothetical protein [Planctomycetaceae bacterium]
MPEVSIDSNANHSLQGDQILTEDVQQVDDVASWIPQVKQFTQQLFPGSISCVEEFDPENPGDWYLLFCVESSLPITEVTQLRRTWHEKLRSLSQTLVGTFRLSIDLRQ